MLKIFIPALLLIAEQASADIVIDGLWTNHDWYNGSYKIGVTNGIPYSKDTHMKHYLTAPMSRDTPMDDYMTLTNVKRVAKILPESEWDVVFPLANRIYSYEGFLK